MRNGPTLIIGIIGTTLVAATGALAQVNEAPLSAATATAENIKLFEAGKIAAKAGNYTDAIRLWTPLGEAGNPVIQEDIGLMYSDGLKDYSDAIMWCKKAAEKGYAPAQISLGEMYHQGLGVSQNSATAVEWFRKAADQGNSRAQFNLGVSYYRGEGVDQSYGSAFTWYQKAANQGLPEAQTSLATLYSSGNGVPKDPVKAFAWYQRAANQTFPAAELSLGLAYATGSGTPQDNIQAYRWLDLATINGKDSFIIDAAHSSMGRLEAVMAPEQVAQARKLVANWQAPTSNQQPRQSNCTAANLSFQPRGDCTGKAIIVPNKGEYATIDVKPIQAAAARLQAAQGGERDAVIADLTAHSDRQAPPTLFLIAQEFAAEANYSEALFWSQAGLVRSLYDGSRCTDPSSSDGVAVLMMNFSSHLNGYRPSADLIEQIATRVLAWDAVTQRNYDPRWLCLHGIAAISTGLGNAQATEHIFVPESQWPSRLEAARTTYRTSVDNAISSLRSVQPPPANTPAAAAAVDHSNAKTVTVDGVVYTNGS